MEASRLNLVLVPMGLVAAQSMAEKLDIPYYFNPPSYELDEVLRHYYNLAGLLGKPCPDFRQEILQTQLAIVVIRERVGDIPVVVDSSASMRPFALAKALLGYGFQVRAVFAPHSPRDDYEERKWLADHCPQVTIINREGIKAVSGYGLDQEYMAIGYDGAFLLKARYFVDVFNDESFYGFHGIRKLMKLMGEAVARAADWGDLKENRDEGSERPWNG